MRRTILSEDEVIINSNIILSSASMKEITSTITESCGWNLIH